MLRFVDHFFSFATNRRSRLFANLRKRATRKAIQIFDHPAVARIDRFAPLRLYLAAYKQRAPIVCTHLSTPSLLFKQHRLKISKKPSNLKTTAEPQ